MAERCSCGYDGDPLVFGECRTCHPKPEVSERPFEQVLSPDELED